jgi:hypothetical protein
MRVLVTVLFCSLVFHAFPQQKFKPSIVILDPYEFRYDSVFSKEVHKYDIVSKPSESARKEFLKTLEGQKENNRIMDLAEFEFRSNSFMNFQSYFTLGLYGMITYRVFGETDKGLIIPSHDKSKIQPEDLKKIAIKHKVDWVLCPVEFSCYMKEGKKYSMARITLYSLSKNRIMMQKDYVGNSINQGLELSCEEGTLKCTTMNLVGAITHEVILAILGSYQH